MFELLDWKKYHVIFVIIEDILLAPVTSLFRYLVDFLQMRGRDKSRVIVNIVSFSSSLLESWPSRLQLHESIKRKYEYKSVVELQKCSTIRSGKSSITKPSVEKLQSKTL